MHYIVHGNLLQLPDDRKPPAGAIPVEVTDLAHRHLYKVRGHRLVAPTPAEIAEQDGLRFSVEEIQALKALAQQHLTKKK
jgi:hypothetical protein